MEPFSLEKISTSIGIPAIEIEKLMACRFHSETRLPAPMGYKHTGFAKDVLKGVRSEISEAFIGRKDFIKNMDTAYRLIMCNMVCCVFDRTCLSLSGSEKDYIKGTYYKKLHLTWAAVNSVTKALIHKGFISKNKASKVSKQVNSYYPTKRLELLVLPLIYMVSEKYTVSTDLVIFKETNREIKPKKDISNSKVKIPNIGTMRRRSYELDLATYQSDLDSLTRINEALDQCTYALKSPVKRIYSYGNPQHGGRLYTRLQGLPDRRARIRINTLLNGEPVAEVDLSANHPRMLMALANKDLSPTFYADIAQATNTTREQVKFLIVKAIGASNRKISLKTIGKETDLSSKAVLTSIERARIERHLETAYPEIFYSLYKGIGTLLQALEGDLLLKAMLDLLDLGIVSLPMHDAIYVQKRYMKHAQVSLENAWMETLGVSFRPYTKIDTYRSSE